MRLERYLYSAVILVAAVIAIVNWRRAEFLLADNDELRSKNAALDAELDNSVQASELARSQSERVRSQISELMQLRNEVTQLRIRSAATNQSVAAENQRLTSDIAQLRASAAGAQGQAEPGRADHFPRDRWSFSGYASPEAALVSAIWAMKEGKPQSYLDSLAPQEQERIAQVWQDKNETEIAQKHQSDVASIAGLRVLERQNISPSEVVMNVFLEGPGRVEKIRMNQVGQDWKYGGFVREQKPP